MAIRDAPNDAAMLPYAWGADPYFEELEEIVERAFYLDEVPMAEVRAVATGF